MHAKLTQAFSISDAPPNDPTDLEKSAPLEVRSKPSPLRPKNASPASTAHAAPLSPGSPAREKLDALTSLRFFAVCAVFLCHSSSIVAAADPSTKGVLLSVLGEGYAGVSFFFTLSGFILCYCYYDKFREIFEDRSLSRRDALVAFATQYKDYFVARVARIYPLHLAALLFSVVLVKTGALASILEPDLGLAEIDTFQIRAFVAQLYLLQAWMPEGQTPIIHMYNAVSWSLSAEFFFYACFPFLCALVYKIRSSSRSAFALAYYALTAVVLMGVCSASSHQHGKGRALAHWFGYYFPGIRLSDFVVGMCSFFWYRRLKAVASARVPNRTAFSAVFEVAPVLFAILTAFSAVAMGVKGWMRYSTWYLPASVCVIVGFALNGPIASTALSNKWLVLQGETSFAFYLFHFMILSSITTHVHGNVYALVALSFVVTSVVAYLASRLVENPARKKIREIMRSC
jgi:peptidoglycan/LPS O-acetylase OafA/YrhL